MSGQDWFRNTVWSEEIEANFIAKLKRARRKEQYLRIQASTIASNYPDIALKLLNQYFSLDDNFDHAQAYCDMASAFLAKCEVKKAVESYLKALDREAEFPKLKTDAYILFPLTVATNKLNEFYELANEVLDRNYDRLMFPVDGFRWHAAKAIILASSSSGGPASDHVNKAFEAAQIKESGFRFHQNLGLVGDKYKNLVDELRAINA